MVAKNWSFNPGDWNNLEAIICDKNVRMTGLKRMNSVQVPQSPGVYLICLKPLPNGTGFASKLFNVVYVGQASNLQSRFIDHVEGRTNVKEVVKNFRISEFWYFELAMDELDFVEKSIYDVLAPAKNQISPPLRGSMRAPVAAN